MYPPLDRSGDLANEAKLEGSLSPDLSEVRVCVYSPRKEPFVELAGQRPSVSAIKLNP